MCACVCVPWNFFSLLAYRGDGGCPSLCSILFMHQSCSPELAKRDDKSLGSSAMNASSIEKRASEVHKAN